MRELVERFLELVGQSSLGPTLEVEYGDEYIEGYVGQEMAELIEEMREAIDGDE